MSRGLDETQRAALDRQATAPYFLVKIALSNDVYISSTDAISWDGHNWAAESMFVSYVQDGPTISIYNGDLALGHALLSSDTAGAAVDVWQGDRNDTAHPNPFHMFSGLMDRVTIAERIVIRTLATKPTRTPRLYVNEPLFNHLPRRGTRFETPNGPIVLG